MAADVLWKVHIEGSIKKANNFFYMLKRNVAIKLNPFVGLFKSLILPVLLYDFTCLNAGKT